MSNDPTPEPRRLLRCPACGRTDDVTHADLMRYTRVGWPKCCGLTMAYFTEAERPADVATRFNHKCPTCGNEWAITFPPGVEVVANAAGECERCRRKTPAVPPV
jgi:hypothetical protein